MERNWLLHYFFPFNRALWCRSTLVLHNYTVSFSPLSYLNWILFGAYRNCYTSSSSLFPTLFRFSLFSTWSGTALALFKLSGFWDSHELRHITMSIFKCFILLKFIILFVIILCITFKSQDIYGNHEDFFSDRYFSNFNLGKWGEWDAFLCPLTL